MKGKVEMFGNYRFQLNVLLTAVICLAAISQGKAKSLRDAAIGQEAVHVWLDAQGSPLPFQDDEEILEFLKTAKPVSRKRVKEGRNGIHKVLLAKDGVRMHAAMRDFRTATNDGQVAVDPAEAFFRDDYAFEVAAYRLSRLLGLDLVPPAVQRNLYGQPVSLQIWVEDTFMEKDRRERQLEHPDPVRNLYQISTVILFDNLINNEDRNEGNILYDNRWNLWMIDHTRAFRRSGQPIALKQLKYCERSLFERLKELRWEDLWPQLRGILLKSEVKALLKRRDRIVRKLESLIQEQGESQVLLPEWRQLLGTMADASSRQSG